MWQQSHLVLPNSYLLAPPAGTLHPTERRSMGRPVGVTTVSVWVSISPGGEQIASL